MQSGVPFVIPGYPPTGFPQAMPQMQNIPQGLKIPMIGDPPKGETKYVRPPLQQIPPTPYSGLPETGGLDWNIIASCSPEEVVKTNDLPTISAIIQSFVRSKFTNTEAQLLPNPLAAKFYRLLQIAVKYLLDTQKSLKSEIETHTDNESKMKQKIQKLSHAISRLKAEAHNSPSKSSEKCPICHKVFKNMDYVDKHIERRHSTILPAWNSVRSGKMQGLDDINDQLTALRQAISRTKAEMEHAIIERGDARVTRIIEEPNQQLRQLADLKRKQEELLERQKNQDRAAINFRREMRNQLDTAVVSLRQVQRRYEESKSSVGGSFMAFDPSVQEKSIDYSPSYRKEDSPSNIEKKSERPRVSFEKPQLPQPESVDSMLLSRNPTPSSRADNRVEGEIKDAIHNRTENVVDTTPSSGRQVNQKQVFEFNFDTSTKPNEKINIPHIPMGEIPVKIPANFNKPNEPPPIRDIDDDYMGSSEIPVISSSRSRKSISSVTYSSESEHTPRRKVVDGDIIARARAFLTEEHNYEGSSKHKSKKMAKIAENALFKVSEQKDKLLNEYPYAVPSDETVAFKLSTGTKEYIEKHDELTAEVDKDCPIFDVRSVNLLEEKALQFRRVAPKKRATLVDITRRATIKLTQEQAENVAKNADPLAGLYKNKRGFSYGNVVLPYDDEIIEGSTIDLVDGKLPPSEDWFASENGRREIVSDLEMDAEYYRRVAPKIKEWKDITTISTSSSSEILGVEEEEVNDFNLNSSSSSSEEEEIKVNEEISKISVEAEEKKPKKGSDSLSSAEELIQAPRQSVEMESLSSDFEKDTGPSFKATSSTPSIPINTANSKETSFKTMHVSPGLASPTKSLHISEMEGSSFNVTKTIGATETVNKEEMFGLSVSDVSYSSDDI